MNKIKINMPKKELKLKMKMVKSIKRKLNKDIHKRKIVNLMRNFPNTIFLQGCLIVVIF